MVGGIRLVGVTILCRGYTLPTIGNVLGPVGPNNCDSDNTSVTCYLFGGKVSITLPIGGPSMGGSCS